MHEVKVYHKAKNNNEDFENLVVHSIEGSLK